MSSREQWTAVDRYYSDLLAPHDPALENALKASSAAGLPSINVSANQGKLLQILAQTCGARNILEIGTLGGYSTIWLARALPAEGRLVSLELDSRHAQVAKTNIAGAGLSDKVEIMIGRADMSLARLVQEKRGPFDLIFIDADKPSTADYFRSSLDLSRPGSLIIVDNVVRNGAVVDASSSDASIQGIRRFNQILAAEKRVTATAIQTVGSKGYDGLVIALVV